MFRARPGQERASGCVSAKLPHGSLPAAEKSLPHARETRAKDVHLPREQSQCHASRPRIGYRCRELWQPLPWQRSARRNFRRFASGGSSGFLRQDIRDGKTDRHSGPKPPRSVQSRSCQCQFRQSFSARYHIRPPQALKERTLVADKERNVRLDFNRPRMTGGKHVENCSPRIQFSRSAGTAGSS